MPETSEINTKMNQGHMRESDVRCPNCGGSGFDYSKEPEFESDTPQCIYCAGTGLKYEE